MPRKREVENAARVKETGERRKSGPPKKPIDWEKVKGQVAAGASGATIAYEIGVTPDTLYVRCQEENGMDFTSFKLLHHGRGDDMIRLKQFEVAVKNGDVAMLKWLGKNRLGQRDRTEFVNPAGEAIPIVMVQVLPPSKDAGQ